MSSLKLSPSQAAISEQKSRQLLDSLRFPGMNERRQHLYEAHTGTFSWIFQPDTRHQHRTVKAKVKITPRPGESYWMSPGSSAEDSGEEPSAPASRVQDPIAEQDTRPWDDFADWLKSESRIYWISGKPGSGKSTLVKFLVDSRKTTEALDIWSQGCGVLSHFFWKPGSLLQRSVKGLLLSLLHQLLSADTTFLESIFAPYLASDLITKSEPSDWSEKELEMALFEALKMLPYRLCIFMDGLDEVCQPEGLLSLLQLVGKLQEIPTIKLCMASRPEPALRSKLSKYRNLRLQDLNAKDMTDYARDILDRCWDDSPISRRSQRSILDALVKKAEGVFLWLRLALKDLQIGILNGDDYEDLMQRLQDLPPELHELYWDMWKRQNESTKAYRDASARYFNILIEARNTRKIDILEPSEVASLFIPRSGISLLEMMGATDAGTQISVFGRHVPRPTSTLEHWERGREAIVRKCAGIIEVSCDRKDDEILHWRHLPLPLHRLVFIHRSAYDFLTDTEHGREILSFDTSSQGFRRLSMINGVLTRLMLVADPRYRELMLCEVIYALSTIREPELDDQVQTTLSFCWQCFNKIRKRRPAHWLSSSFDFLSVAAFPRSSFHHFIVGHIKKSENPAELATRVLRSIHYLWGRKGSIFKPEKDASSLIESLLALGADAHAIDLLMPGQASESFSGFVSNISPFGGFIKEATICDNVDPEYLRKCLNLFLAQKPALDQRIALSFWVFREAAGRISVDLMQDIRSQNHEPEGWDADLYLLDVNIAFLVQVMLERIGPPSLATVPLLHLDTLEPSARTIIVSCGSIELIRQLGSCPITFRVRDSDISRLVVDMFRPWLCSNSRKELTEHPAWKELLQEVPKALAIHSSSVPTKLEPYEGMHWELMEEIGCEYVKAPAKPRKRKGKKQKKAGNIGEARKDEREKLEQRHSRLGQQ